MLKRLVGYAAYMAGTTSFVSLITFAVSLLGFKTRTKDSVGDYYTYLLIYGVTQAFLISGVNPTVQKIGAEEDGNRIRFAKLAYLGFALIALLLSFVGVMVGLTLRWSYGLAFIGAPWIVVWWWAQYILRANLDYRREARLVIFASISNSMLQLAFLTLTPYADALIYGDVIALVLSGLLALYVIRRGVGASFSEILRTPLPREFLSHSFRFLGPLWLSGQVYTLNSHLSGALIRAKVGAAGMGAYGVMQTLFGFAQKPLEFLKAASLPGLVQEKDEKDVLYREVLRILMVIYPLLVVGLAATSPLIFLVTGMADKWPEVPLMLFVAALGAPAYALEMVANQYAIALGLPRVQLYAQITQAVALVLVLYPAVLAYGIYGALLASVVSTVLHALAYAVMLWRIDRASMKTGLWWMVYTTVATILCGYPVYVSRSYEHGWLVGAPITLFWLLFCFAVGMVSREDFRRVFRAVSGLRARS